MYIQCFLNEPSANKVRISYAGKGGGVCGLYLVSPLDRITDGQTRQSDILLLSRGNTYMYGSFIELGVNRIHEINYPLKIDRNP